MGRIMETMETLNTQVRNLEGHISFRIENLRALGFKICLVPHVSPKAEGFRAESV